MPYDFRTAEPKWQQRWAREHAFATDHDLSKPKAYVLDMFPYPSGAGLHVGHCEGYTATDVLARYKRARGYRVLHPMGWDAFGLPAENYAIRTGVHPRETTASAIATFKSQINALGLSYDWSHEINTTDPEYYRWTQWIFLQLYKKGLAFQDVVPINWCPNDRTGLANEEVKQGRCERCGTLVERRDLRQWMLRITSYADRLLADLDGLDWPEGTLAMQREWIGRSDGAEVTFRVAADSPGAGADIVAFTTRPDTLHGATYMVLAPEHALVDRITTDARKADVQSYVHASRTRSERERTDIDRPKTGVFTGAHAINPVNDERVPVWVADYVIAGYGTGAIMAVPAHDERDHAFARAHGLPIVPVIAPRSRETLPENRAFIESGANVFLVNSGAHTGLSSIDAQKAIVNDLFRRGLGRPRVGYKLRDWVFSRQRYWGEPMPVVHCAACGVVPVPENELPVMLPDVQRYEPSGTGESPLATMESWVNTSCPRCKAPAQRETNTMPQWAGSCWYYLRFLDPKNTSAPWSPEVEKAWMPVDMYIGGAEHAVLHLLYARFWHKVLFDLGHVSTPEPFARLRHQGMVLSYAYRDGADRWKDYSDVELRGSEAYSKSTGERLTSTVEKMSKTRQNVINPTDVIENSGADSLRLYELFMGDFEQPKPWDTRAIAGVVRFLQNVWKTVEDTREVVGEPNERLRHKTVQAVSDRIEALKFNTAISALMEFVGVLNTRGSSHADRLALVRLVAPFAPHIAEEAWEALGQPGLVCKAAWPSYDPALTIDQTVTVPVQVSGKTRGTVDVPRGADENTVREAALTVEAVARAMQGKSVVKVVFVPDRMLNLVVK